MVLCFTIHHTTFTIKFQRNIFCVVFHDISQYFMKCCTPMSIISLLWFFSTIVSLLGQGARHCHQNSHWVALPSSIIAHATHGQFLGSKRHTRLPGHVSSWPVRRSVGRPRHVPGRRPGLLVLSPTSGSQFRPLMGPDAKASTVLRCLDDPVVETQIFCLWKTFNHEISWEKKQIGVFSFLLWASKTQWN